MYASLKKYTAGAIFTAGMLLASVQAVAGVACFRCKTSTVCVLGLCIPVTTCEEISCPVEK